MANHMEEVARILGVELGEEFTVRVQDNQHLDAMITEDGIRALNGPEYFKKYNASVCLHNLLNGTLSVERKHWTPSYNESYYSIGIGGTLEPGTWMNDFIDVALYKLGNCYRTPQEAEVNSDKWIAFYASDEVLEV